MIFVDIETTGMDPEENSLLSIGAVDFDNPENTFYGECRADKGSALDPISLTINGFGIDDILDPNKMMSQELVRKFLVWASAVRDKKLAGDNIWFDLGFLRVYLKRLKIRWPFGRESVELHRASKITRGLPWSLDLVLEIAGIPPRESYHNALNDALLEAEAYSRLKFGKGLLPKFSEHPLPKLLIKGGKPKK